MYSVTTALGQPMTYTLTIPDFLPTTKGVLRASHWRKAWKLKKGDEEVIGWAFRASGIPRATGKRRVSVRYLSPHRPADPDARWWVLLDGLVKAGAIMDDSEEYVALGRVRSSRGPRATIVSLEDLPR